MRKNTEIETIAHLTCPYCHLLQTVAMPTDACQYFYICQKCGKRLKPKNGDCCVFCSYADTKCPSKQEESILSTTTSSNNRVNSVK